MTPFKDIFLGTLIIFAVLKRKLGWKETVAISLFTVMVAIVVGALFNHLAPVGLSTQLAGSLVV